MYYNKKNKSLIEKIVLIKRENNINIIEIDDNIENIDSNEILNLINKDYKITTNLGTGGQATVNDIGNNLVARISNNKEFTEKFSEKNNEILSRLNGMKNGSTTPIHNFIILGKNKKFKTIEIFKKREKGNLKETRDKEEILSQIPLMEQLINGLKNIHSAGLIHRDIKPENILIDSNNKATFSDFGLTITTNSKSLQCCGSPKYVAPEAMGSDPIINQKNDIYSLGIVFLENFLKDYKNDFFEFIKPEFEDFCKTYQNILKGKELKEKFMIFIHSSDTDVSKFIKKDKINLENFLPKEILENTINKEPIKHLKKAIVELIKHMVTKDLKKRYTIFDVKEEFDEIKKFIKGNFECNNKKINAEDYLFLNKQQITEEVKNRELYRSGLYNNDTINAAYLRLKNSLESLLSKEQVNQEPIFWKKNNEITQDIENRELENILQSLSKEKSLSSEAIECFNYLNDCIDENGDIKDLNIEFYVKIEDLRNNNIEEYLMVMSKLNQLRELKIAIKIKELKKHKNINKNKIKKLKNLYNNIKLVINIPGEMRCSKIEEEPKKIEEKLKKIEEKLKTKIDNLQINFVEIDYKKQEQNQKTNINLLDKDDDLSDKTKNKKKKEHKKKKCENNNDHEKEVEENSNTTNNNFSDNKKEEVNSNKQEINQEIPKIEFKREKEQTAKNRKKGKTEEKIYKEENNISSNQENENNNNNNTKKETEEKNTYNINNINENKQEKEFKNVIEFKREKEQTIENKIEEILNNKENPEMLIADLLKKKDAEEKTNIINRIFDKALKTNCTNVINILFNKKYLDLKSKDLFNKCINTILNTILNDNLKLSDILLDNIKNNDSILYISIINNIFSIAYTNDNSQIINKLFSNKNIDNFIELSFVHKEFAMPIFEPIDIICNSNFKKNEGLIKNFVSFINNKNYLVINELINILYKNNRLDTINKIFDVAFENGCVNTINTILTNKNCKNFFDLKLKNKIKDNPNLIYETISAGKTGIAKILIENSIGFKEVNSVSKEIKIENKENFDNLKMDIFNLIKNKNQYNNNAKEFKENVKKLNKIKVKVKNRFVSIFSSKRPKYNYISTEDFDNLNSLFSLISEENLSYRIN